jgi:hypothetical protein
MNRSRLTLCISFLFLALQGASPAQHPPKHDTPLVIFDGSPKPIVVNGYSTSFRWPALLQEKLDHHTGGKRLITVRRATKGGTPIAKWINVDTAAPLPPWLTILRPALSGHDSPVIVLAQQSLQWTFGDRHTGIAGKEDHARIKKGADTLERYASLLKKDGATLVFIAMHIYKHPMEPAIGNERLALAAFLARNPKHVHAGPDVWLPTSKKYPDAFAADGLHPNDLGAEIMAQLWFESLLSYDDPKNNSAH